MFFGRVCHHYLSAKLLSRKLSLPKLSNRTQEGRKAELVSLTIFFDLLDVPIVSFFSLLLSKSGASGKFGLTLTIALASSIIGSIVCGGIWKMGGMVTPRGMVVGTVYL